MAGVDSWEKTLRNILTETEANISSYKRNMSPRFESTPFSQRYSNPGTREGLSAQFSASPAGYNQRKQVFPDRMKLQSGQYESSSSLVLSMSNRVEQLEQLTNSLNNTVLSLQYENKVQNEEVKRLKDELKHLTKRLHEKGVDVATEKKLKMWQRETRSELDTIRSLIKTKAKSDDYNTLNDVTLLSLSKEISDSKRLLQEETDMLRRETDNLRTRILKLENEVAGVVGESKDLGMRQLRLEKDVSSVNDQYRMQSRSFSKIDKEYTIIQKEIDRVTHEMEKIYRDLNSIGNPKHQNHSEERGHKRTKNSKLKSPKDPAKNFAHENRYSGELFANSLDNFSDLSILSTELEDLSLNTSLQLSDEVDSLDPEEF
ncbi:uncharacterized protein LOC135694752 isoform X2 [Rhopilema esculentum]|uniref:uncharacterized protein LOC135694752 isoform X2 n=1 Tax=Rhopilema esculentum TaxID=499914 RepID=UPI0031DAB889